MDTHSALFLLVNLLRQQRGKSCTYQWEVIHQWSKNVFLLINNILWSWVYVHRRISRTCEQLKWKKDDQCDIILSSNYCIYNQHFIIIIINQKKTMGAEQPSQFVVYHKKKASSATHKVINNNNVDLSKIVTYFRFGKLEGAQDGWSMSTHQGVESRRPLLK